MSRYIDADKFKDFMDMTCDAGGLMYPVVMEIKEYVKKQIDGQPTADVRPNVHGRWKRRLVDSGFNADWVCSCCGHRVMTDFVNYNFCPNCGADMDGVSRDRQAEEMLSEVEDENDL